MHIPVIYEDDNVLALNKPSGIVVHPFDFSNEETVLDFLHETHPGIFSITNEFTLQDGRTINLGGIAHKLDRDTSGVLLVAKNQKTFDECKRQFTEQKIEKRYVALVEGVLEKDALRIDAPLGRGKKDYKQSTKPINPRGHMREAITDVAVIEQREGMTLVELSPLTGRTHQLRAHMSSIGHPIVGDIAYGSKMEHERIMLHAASLICIIDGHKRAFTAPLPYAFN